jgi:hypothetical protein
MNHSFTVHALALTSLFAVSNPTYAENIHAPQLPPLTLDQKKTLMARPKKIVGLIAARNEAPYIDQCVRALALYTDAIVVLDDASEDDTVAIVQSLAQECHIERVIKKTVWHRDEPGDRNKLLQAGREIGGTHFIVLNADEMITATCLKNNFLRNKILALEPCNRIMLHLIRLQESMHRFKKEAILKFFIFCDDGQSTYVSDFIHTPRIPITLYKRDGKDVVIGELETYGVLHFDEINFQKRQVKKVWYRCLERIRTNKTIAELNGSDTSDTQNQETLLESPTEWFAYPFFNVATYEAPEHWREKQILEWVATYGIDFFAGLHLDPVIIPSELKAQIKI